MRFQAGRGVSQKPFGDILVTKHKIGDKRRSFAEDETVRFGDSILPRTNQPVRKNSVHQRFFNLSLKCHQFVTNFGDSLVTDLLLGQIW